jgi:hypothetical protein
MPGDDGSDGGAAHGRSYYEQLSNGNAFGSSSLPAWDPAAGYRANRPRILRLYDYYRDVYLKRPDLFLWAGLGRMAGGAVVSGLDIVSVAGETPLTQTMVQIGKSIFEDLAWQHEAFLDDPTTAIALAAARDAEAPARRSYADAWRDIGSGDADRVVRGNLVLLENEQFTIIQPQYDSIASGTEATIFRRTRAFTNKIHPYHRDFLIVRPTGDVIQFDDRWAWITETDGMWDKWVKMIQVAPPERTRLVSLSFDDILRQNFAPVVESLLPPGADDE